MTVTEVDGSLIFRFSGDWSTLRWEDADAHKGARAASRKKVDIAATGPSALLIEVKDDRIKDKASRGKRKKAIQTGTFAEDVSMKFRHSADDICEAATHPDSGPFYRSFVTRWNQGSRQFVLWWELPPEPPSGQGTWDNRWKAHLSALQNTLKQHLRDLTPRVRIANQRFHPDVVRGMEVADVAAGIAGRRDSMRPSVPRR